MVAEGGQNRNAPQQSTQVFMLRRINSYPEAVPSVAKLDSIRGFPDKPMRYFVKIC